MGAFSRAKKFREEVQLAVDQSKTILQKVHSTYNQKQIDLLGEVDDCYVINMGDEFEVRIKKSNVLIGRAMFDCFPERCDNEQDMYRYTYRVFGKNGMASTTCDLDTFARCLVSRLKNA